MSLHNRYLSTLRLFLPKAQREDIIRELSEEIETDIAERERGLGRSLTLDEEASVVGRYGHPLVAAARYQRQRHLIGPLVFPHYWLLLRVVLALVVAGHVLGGGIRLADGAGWAEIAGVAEHLVQTSLKTVGWLTLLAAAADLWLSRSGVLERWNPRTLVFARQGREHSLSRFIMQTALSAWWLLALKFPVFFFASGADIASWGPAMNRVYPVLAISVIAEAARQFVRLRSPIDTRLSGALTASLTISTFVFLVLMLTSSHEWVVWSDAPHRRVVDLVNYAFSIAFTVAAIVGAASAAWAVIRFLIAPKRLVAVAACCGVIAPLLVQAQDRQAPPLPEDAAIRQMLVERVDVKRQTVGIVVGIVTPSERRVVAYGRLAKDDPRVVDGDTIFEIGSVTKVFTALLLADAAVRGEVGIDDAVTAYLPAAGKLTSTTGKPMSLADLATHTSGLPFWPSSIPPTPDGVRQMSSYTIDQLYQYTGAFEVPPDVGSRWVYSNMDAGLLGLALARRSETSYERLLKSRVTDPLGMKSSAVAVVPAMQSRLAAGHDKGLVVAPRWNVPTLAGAGSLHSTANDLLTLLAVAMGHVESPLSPAFRSMLATQRKGPAFQQALGWWVFTNDDSQVITHVGGTLGFAAQVAYDPKRQIGVAVLSNSVNPISDLIAQVLNPPPPVAP